MATESQYEFFRLLYQEEDTRYEQLGTRAQVYMGIVTFFLGIIGFKVTDIKQVAVQFSIPEFLLSLCGTTFLVALLLCVVAIRIRAYEGIADPEEIIDNFGDFAPTDADFFDDRIIDLAVATNLNFDQNERTANFLSWASVFLFIAIALFVVDFVFVLSVQR
jgi:hypothetical protein